MLRGHNFWRKPHLHRCKFPSSGKVFYFLLHEPQIPFNFWFNCDSYSLVFHIICCTQYSSSCNFFRSFVARGKPLHRSTPFCAFLWIWLNLLGKHLHFSTSIYFLLDSSPAPPQTTTNLRSWSFPLSSLFTLLPTSRKRGKRQQGRHKQKKRAVRHKAAY